ncbi:MAG: hypothetical protein SOX84_04535, partial [Prevotella sp.]|nr:hypothetical protein [Prevotella sp.]
MHFLNPNRSLDRLGFLFIFFIHFSTACTCLSASSSSFSLEVARYVCDKTLNNLHRPSAAISLNSNDRFGLKRNLHYV